MMHHFSAPVSSKSNESLVADPFLFPTKVVPNRQTELNLGQISLGKLFLGKYTRFAPSLENALNCKL